MNQSFQKDTILDRLMPKEQIKFDCQRKCACDHGTICEGMRGKIEDAIVAWMDWGLPTGSPLTHRSRRLSAVRLAVDIMDVVNEKWTTKKQQKGKKT